jgi:hypothetical protein
VSEKELEEKLGRFAKSRGCLYYKFSSPARRGVPDRIVIAPNSGVLFLELKAPGKTPTALQLRELRILQEQGQKVAWVDSLEEGKKAISFLCDVRKV